MTSTACIGGCRFPAAILPDFLPHFAQATTADHTYEKQIKSQRLSLFYTRNSFCEDGATSLFKEVVSKAMRDFCPGKQVISRGLRPNLLILNKGAITSLSLFKTFTAKGLFSLVPGRDSFCISSSLRISEKGQHSGAHPDPEDL